MLWFDNSKSTLEAKIAKAAEYYTKKYGIKPNTCLVHPSMMDKDARVEGVEVRPYRPVLPGHIWVGIEDE